MNPSIRTLLVLALGLLSTTQNHLAKALQRQGIEALDTLRAWLRREKATEAGPDPDRSRRQVIVYVTGLVLNNTVFVYHLLVAPLGGTTALYTGMFGAGLIALLIYTARVMKERITRRELAGAVAILLGTLTIGLEGVARPALRMGQMDLGETGLALGALGLICAALIVAGLRARSLTLTGLAFGLSSGALGALDPFLKGVGQSAGGGGRFAPGTTAGWIVFAASFVVGFAAFLVTQWGFARRARASVLVPAFNGSYVATPIALQALLLPGYVVTGITAAGLGLLALGFGLMRGFGRENT